MMEMLWEYWLMIDEPIGTVLGFVIVLCLIRQNLWAWPLGIVYVAVSVSVLLEARLYANLVLHVAAFLPMNIYGWYYWIFGKKEDQQELPVTRSSWTLLIGLVLVCAVCTAALGTFFLRYTDAALPYWDNALFVSSIVTMWLTARKKIENWVAWFIIDVVSVGVYWTQGLHFYAFLYFIYLGMAVAGWMSWQKSMQYKTDSQLS
ncbi:MAG: nicotinamide mononucleotide transporter [Pseudomonadales bacterium]|nr:nicotinamide mononucleotide transporter [Pseudomonadales bacterium]